MTRVPHATRIRRSRCAVLALLLLALAGSTLQNVWHKPMALAAAGSPAFAAVICGGPLSAADIAQLVGQGILPAGADGGSNTLCDLLTVPVVAATALPTLPADAVPPAVAAFFPPALAATVAQTRLPPARAPPHASAA